MYVSFESNDLLVNSFVFIAFRFFGVFNLVILRNLEIFIVFNLFCRLKMFIFF